jgi:hypothetical protein
MAEAGLALIRAAAQPGWRVSCVACGPCGREQNQFSALARPSRESVMSPLARQLDGSIGQVQNRGSAKVCEGFRQPGNRPLPSILAINRCFSDHRRRGSTGDASTCAMVILEKLMH